MGLVLKAPSCGVSLYTRPPPTRSFLHDSTAITNPADRCARALRRGTSPAARFVAASLRGNTTVTGGTRSNEHRKHVCIRVRISKTIQHTHQVRAHRSRIDDRVRICHGRLRAGNASATRHTAARAGVASGESWQPGDSCRWLVGHSNAHGAANDTTTIRATDDTTVRTTNHTADGATSDAACQPPIDTAIRAGNATTVSCPR